MRHTSLNMIGVGTFKASPLARQYVNEVLDSGRLSYGKFTREFEKKFANTHGCSEGVMSSSGTMALLIALAALKKRNGWQDGDEVIVPAITFIATSNVVLQLSLKPVFVDVDPIFYSLDPALIEEKITARTRCIIPAHLFGCPCDMDPIMALARKHGLKVVEDSCETMFTEYKGKSVGSFGDVGCFSTYMAHILTTGVGGLSLTSDTALATQLRSLINHGRDPIYLNIDDDDNRTQADREEIIAKRFSIVHMGYSARVTEMEGALGLAGLQDMSEIMRKRVANAASLTMRLSKFTQLQLPEVRKGSGHGFMVYPVVLKKENKRKLVNFLEENGIETRDMLPITNQPLYRDLLQIREGDFPVAKWINQGGFYIGCHQDLSAADLTAIEIAFAKYFQGTK
ncbi:MAG: DegT/DnrJ/EryC1/StrS family aminotransferase [Bdellovibrionota bacterium]